MIARAGLSSILCALVFVAPMVIHPDRLLQPAPWLGLVVALVILLSQPETDLRESARRTSADRGSAIGIFVAMIVAQAAAAIDFAVSPFPVSVLVFTAGAVIAIGGLVLRLWAIRTLGRFFTSTVRVVGDQSVVRSGPYRVLRHPSYTGALCSALGTAIAFGSGIGAALVIALCVPAYLYRIATEERALVSQLGEPYRRYRGESWGLVPGLR